MSAFRPGWLSFTVNTEFPPRIADGFGHVALAEHRIADDDFAFHRQIRATNCALINWRFSDVILGCQAEREMAFRVFAIGRIAC